MSDIDFQNGLVVGMTLAGKNGLVGEAGEIDKSPKIIRAENLDFYMTEIEFDRPIKSFDTFDALSWFFIIAEEFWFIQSYTVSQIIIVSSTVLRFIHSSIEQVDNTVLVIYNGLRGSVEGTNNEDVKNTIYSYIPTLEEGILKIRVRGKIQASFYPVLDEIGIEYLESMSIPIQEEVYHDFLEIIDFDDLIVGAIEINLFGITEDPGLQLYEP